MDFVSLKNYQVLCRKKRATKSINHIAKHKKNMIRDKIRSVEAFEIICQKGEHELDKLEMVRSVVRKKLLHVILGARYNVYSVLAWREIADSQRGDMAILPRSYIVCYCVVIWRDKAPPAVVIYIHACISTYNVYIWSQLRIAVTIGSYPITHSGPSQKVLSSPFFFKSKSIQIFQDFYIYTIDF